MKVTPGMQNTQSGDWNSVAGSGSGGSSSSGSEVLQGLDKAPFSSYTIGMKTAVSLPDEIFESAEKLASRLKVSRSELYARALQDYVRQHAPSAVTEAYDEICSELETRPDAFVRRAARVTVTRGEW